MHETELEFSRLGAELQSYAGSGGCGAWATSQERRMEQMAEVVRWRSC